MIGRGEEKATKGFFDALMGTGRLTKTAVDLEPETADLLGIPTVSPSILDQLEAGASGSSSDSGMGTSPASAPEVPHADDPVAQAPVDAPAQTVHPAMAPLLEPPAPVVDQEFPADEDQLDQEPDGEETVPSRFTHGKLFSDKRAHPIQILEVLTARYKTAWADWEPETRWWALRRDFGPVGELARNKVMALAVAVRTDAPWQDWDIFEDSGLAWNDTIPIFGAFQPMSPMQTAFAVQVLRKIRSDEPFAAEVNVYIAAILEDHGWVYAPEEWFAGAQEVMARKLWLAPLRSQIEQAWQQVVGMDFHAIEWKDDRVLDVHLMKMKVVQRYLEDRELLHAEIPRPSAAAPPAAPPVP